MNFQINPIKEMNYFLEPLHMFRVFPISNFWKYNCLNSKLNARWYECGWIWFRIYRVIRIFSHVRVWPPPSVPFHFQTQRKPTSWTIFITDGNKVSCALQEYPEKYPMDCRIKQKSIQWTVGLSRKISYGL